MSEIDFSNIFNQNANIKRIIPKLLKDQTTGKNIVWATDTYQPHGKEYEKQKQNNKDFEDNILNAIHSIIENGEKTAIEVTEKDIKISSNHFKLFDTLPSSQAGTLEEDLDKIFNE